MHTLHQDSSVSGSYLDVVTHEECEFRFGTRSSEMSEPRFLQLFMAHDELTSTEENWGSECISSMMRRSEEVHCAGAGMTPFTAPRCIAGVYKSLRCQQESQVQTQLHLETFPPRYRVIMYSIKVLVVVALCATRTLAAPQRPSGGADRDAVITSQQLDVNFDGNYINNFETSNGISHQETGQPKQIDNEIAVVAQGADSWIAPDGQQISITYVADENGYQAQGSHIPTAPPIPPEILRALEWNAAHPEEDDGGVSRPIPSRG